MSSSSQFQRGRQRTRYRYLPITLKPVEEIEGKGSPNDNSESINEGSSSFSGGQKAEEASRHTSISSHSDGHPAHSDSTGKTHDSSRSPSESPAHRSKSNQRWMKLRTTVQLSGAITSTVQKKATLKREDSFLKRFSTRQVPEAQETFEIGEDDGSGGGGGSQSKYRRKKKRSLPRSVVNPDGNFYFYWLFLLTVCVLYNLWTLIVRESFPELQENFSVFWITSDAFTDLVIFLDLAVQFRTGYLEQGLMVYKTRKLANHYAGSKHFWFDVLALLPTDLLQLYFGTHPMFRIPRFLKTYRMYNYYYMVESRTVYPNVWRVVNLIHILLLLAHWFGCFYYLISEAEGFTGPWVYPNPNEDPRYAPLIRKYLGSLYWSTLTLTTIGDLPTPYSNWQLGNRSIPFDPNSYGGYRNHSHKSRLLHIHTNNGYLFTIVSYLIGVFIFATIVGQVGNVITNRNANRLEFERLLDGAKMYMRHHRVPRDMQRRVLRWYDYSWSRGRIQGGGDINTALGLLPDKLKTELALHVNLSVLKKVTIFQECQPEFLHDLVLKMKAYIFTPGDLICRKGEVAREMFIIADGILEVIGETGRVLTTMQAGDFFGEIGILNLDGLNKRTADVRSVGYSELFSLSREDVLAAMKDYPEAQDILQSLGKKRLLDARRANAPVKKVEKKSPLTLLGHSMVAKGPDDNGPNGGEPNTTGKRIVEKLRNDVKGLRNAIRKSRKSNSSKEDSSEPESGKDKLDSSGSGRSRKESTVSVQQQYAGSTSIMGSMIPASAASRGVLKRMHNVVLSDEMEKVGIGGDTSMSNLSPTILPKRVQMQLPLGDEGHSRSQFGGDREVIGAGLPLIQRLRLLKQKEEKERLQPQKLEQEKPVLLPRNSDSKDPTKESTIKIAPPTQEKSIFQTRVSIEPPPLPQPPSSLPSATTTTTTQHKIRRGSSESSQVPHSTTVIAPPIIPSQSTSRPKTTATTSKDSRRTSSESNTSEQSPELDAGNFETESRIQGREIRPSALRFQKRDTKNYGSVDDLSPEFSRLPFIKKLKILNERQKIAELLTTKTSTLGLLTRSTSEGSSEIPHSIPTDAENMHSVILGRRTQSSSEPYQGQGQGHGHGQGQTNKRDHHPPPFALPLPSPSSSSSSSPEAKSSKIHFPERVQDSKGLLAGSEDEPIRIRSESNRSDSNRAEPTQATTTVCLTTEAGEGGAAELSPQASPPYSPECNETPERRHLKSILKTLAKSKKGGTVAEPLTSRMMSKEEPSPVSNMVEETKLLKEPTIAGYAARHRKFAKNVTFQRQAVAVLSPSESFLPHFQNVAEQEKDGEGERRLETGLEELVELDHAHNQTGNQLHQIPLPLELILGSKKEMDDFPGRIPQVGLALAEEECIGSVFVGIKNIIQSRMEEFQLRFQDRFSGLEKEVRQRDEIISLLQLRIQELEKNRRIPSNHSNPSLRFQGSQIRRTPFGETLGGPLGGTLGNPRLTLENHHDGDSYDEDEDDDDEGSQRTIKIHRRRSNYPPQSSFLFSRGDSIDTVIDNTEVYDDDDEVFVDAGDEHGIPLSLQGSLQGNLQGSQVNAQWTVAERESIEVTEYTGPEIPLWQLEFHCEASRPLNLDNLKLSPLGSKRDAVAVDIGNTSTEYESTSSEEDQKKEEAATLATLATSSRQLKEIPFPLDDSGKSSEEDDEDGDIILESSDSDEFDNQNWEVQMLAKEMTKREERELAIEKTEQLDEFVVDEMLELDNEIQEMRDVVNSGALSPTELDMLESMLESRTERVQALFKAYSVDETGRPSLPSSSSTTALCKPGAGGRSIGDFRPRTSVQYTHSPFAFTRRGSSRHPNQGTQAMTGDKRPGDPDTSGSGSSWTQRKKPNVRRQSSLCETGFPAQLASTYLTKRRESAGSLGLKVGNTTGATILRTPSSSAPTAGKSFLSRFNFMRSLSRTFLYHPETSTSCLGQGEGGEQLTHLSHHPHHRLPEINSADSPPYSVSSPIQIPNPASSLAESSFSIKSSSPATSTILPTLPSSVSSAKNDDGTSQSGQSQPIFTIPAVTLPQSMPPLQEHQSSPMREAHQAESHHHPRPSGESQPLLKK